MMEAERARDAEFARLHARHQRDKQLISQLKLKIERQRAELIRADEVPSHEAELYMDLLSGHDVPLHASSGAGAGTAGGLVAAAAGSYPSSDDGLAEDNETIADPEARARRVSFEGGYDIGRDIAKNEKKRMEAEREKSMEALLAEQEREGDVMSARWTEDAIEKQEKRRKEWKKKIENECVATSPNEFWANKPVRHHRCPPLLLQATSTRRLVNATRISIARTRPICLQCLLRTQPHIFLLAQLEPQRLLRRIARGPTQPSSQAKLQGLAQEDRQHAQQK